MSKGRLTRQELGWLLTQEAQGAAERLRYGVHVLKTNPPPAGEGVGLDDSLAALDDAMRMLSSLHNRPSAARGRRGRVDLAALLWELAPDAQLSIEPGSGTEVFGDEAELRRLLSLMIGHGSGTGQSVSVKRTGDEVHVSVVLGPDSTASAAAERAWLARMAVRYGGHYELEGGMEVVTLPADAERKEREHLEKELDEARKQGEAYARELAASFSPEMESVSPSTFPPPLGGAEATSRFGALARLAGGVAAELRTMLSPAARHLATLHEGATAEQLDAVRRALVAAQELVSSLASVGNLDSAEPAGSLDLAGVVGTCVARERARAERAGVKLRYEPVKPSVLARVSARAANVMAEQLLIQAIAASPRGTEVVLRVSGDDATAWLVVEDAGPTLPMAARKAVVELEVEPGTYGRPSSLPLYLCAQLAAWQGAQLEVADAEHRGVRVTVTFAH